MADDNEAEHKLPTTHSYVTDEQRNRPLIDGRLGTKVAADEAGRRAGWSLWVRHADGAFHRWRGKESQWLESRYLNTLEAEVTRLRTLVGQLHEDDVATKLCWLADWLDLKDADRGDEVQQDLRRWAALLADAAALEVQG